LIGAASTFATGDTTHHADLRLYDALRRLRTLRGYQPVRYHAHDTTYRRAFNIEPNMCWECYACIKACPQFAIDCRGYADFAPLGHSVRVRREEDKATISWKIQFRDGREKNFVSPIRSTPWGSIKSPADYEPPSAEAMKSQQLAHEPEALKVAALPALSRDRFKQGLG
jgi:adenylylsulfate reductase subunit B